MTPARSLMPQMVRQQMESYVRQLTPVQRNWATTVARKLAAVKGPISLSQLRLQAGMIPGGAPGGSIDLVVISIIGTLIGLLVPDTNSTGGGSGSSRPAPTTAASELSAEGQLLQLLLNTLKEAQRIQDDALKQAARGA